MAVINGNEILVTVGAKDVGLSSLLTELELKAGKVAKKFAELKGFPEIGKVTGADRANFMQVTQLAEAQAKGAALAGKYMEAIDKAKKVTELWHKAGDDTLEQKSLNTVQKLVNDQAAAAKKAEVEMLNLARSQAQAAASTGNFTKAQQIMENAANKATDAIIKQRAANSAVQFQKAGVSQVGTNERAIQQVAMAQAKGAIVAGDYAKAQNILRDAMGRVTQGGLAYQNMSNNLASINARLTSVTKNSATSLYSLHKAIVNVVGTAYGLQVIANALSSIVTAGNQLEKTEATFKALSGTFDAYQKNLAAAKNQQALFGGTLQQNMEDMTSFVYTAKLANVNIEELTNVARRLSIIDPVQICTV